MIEQSFFTLLHGLGLSVKIYPLLLPTEPTLPAISYTFIGGTANPTLDTSGLTKYRVKIDSWGSTYSDAVTLRSAVKQALNGLVTANMTVQWVTSTDDFDHELLTYRACSEYVILSTL